MAKDQRRKPYEQTQHEAYTRVLNLFNEIDDYLNLPFDEDEWTQEDYEDEREEIGVRLEASFAKVIALKRELTAAKAGAHPEQQAALGGQTRLRRLTPQRFGGVRSELTESIALETTNGKRAVVVPLESGVYLVGEVNEHILASANPNDVGAALEGAASASLLGKRCSHWTRTL